MGKGVAFAFQIGGRELDPAQMEDPQEAALLQEIVESVVDRTELLQCSEHGEPPRFLCSGENINELSLEVFGCCESLVGEVEKLLNEAAE
ncbi:hypothetical protein [Thiohalomonas denitrificans]|uniref:Uncharacterized protein n=1 Tax=Thiohalomonas denitrificans TaxID=415747 RepID=A0A1G5PKB6_9GAMM|nr:hypothetical protein [Thiohalomonas denitrificans]SCZ49975.1 hypothetical protein SAMN03097708_00308 [Thiohalomonas denitrificans]